MLTSILRITVLTAMLIPGTATVAQSQPNIGGVGSVLIFPVFLSSAGQETILTITNRGELALPCGNGFRITDVEVAFRYRNAVGAGTTRIEFLSAGDQVTVIVSRHNPALMNTGYLIVEALDPETGLPIQYDNLMGSATVLHRNQKTQWDYLPYSFKAYPHGGSAPVDGCGRKFTDTGGSDLATLNFDGVEYDAFPQALDLDKTFGWGPWGSLEFSGTFFGISSGTRTDLRAEAYDFDGRGTFRTFSQSIPWFGISLHTLAPDLALNSLPPDSPVPIGTGSVLLSSTAMPPQAVLAVFVQLVQTAPNTFLASAKTLSPGSTPVTVALTR